MTTYYADHTEFKLQKDSAIKDIVVLGGLLIDEKEEQKLTTIIRKVKTSYVNPDLPIKYNFRDLKPVYDTFNLTSEFQAMLTNSVKWRKELFSRSLDVNYQIIVAVIKNFQAYKKEQKGIKPDLLGFAFSDVLMRVALEVRTKKLFPACVILDWPESNNPKPFNTTYYFAYWRGKQGRDKIIFQELSRATIFMTQYCLLR